MTQDLSKKKLILYIEDNPANLRLIERLVAKKTAYELMSAHTGSLGLDLATAYKPDLILLDINLPGVDGYQVLSSLNKNCDTREIPVVAISANALPDDIDKGLRSGFKAYITKPIDLTKLLDTLDQFLEMPAL